MDLKAYRESDTERIRSADLLRLLPSGTASLLEVGARDGHLSGLFAKHVSRVVPLDILPPASGRVTLPWVCGDAMMLPFATASFDAVLCAEVLEHLNGATLSSACAELKRVTRRTVIIGVPFEQDLRIGRTTCRSCGRHNPPYGHVNSFTLDRLSVLFQPLVPMKVSYVGETREATNSLATFLMDLAGNPWGTYDQAEPCTHCQSPLTRPQQPSILERLLAKSAGTLNRAQTYLRASVPSWIHVAFEVPGLGQGVLP